MSGQAYRLDEPEPGVMPPAIEAWGHRYILVEEWQMVVNRPRAGQPKALRPGRGVPPMAYPQPRRVVRERRVRYARPVGRHFWRRAVLTFLIGISPFVAYVYLIGSW